MSRYYIVVYDVNEKRVVKVHHILREYLQWRQRSVFEGWLTRAQLNELMRRLSRVINEEEDTVLFYSLKSDMDVRTFYLGKPPDELDNVI